jgi:predicted nucleic acid-binding protein
MSGNNFLADTNIIIFHLAGNADIEALFDNSILYVSALTYAELLSKSSLSAEDETIIKEYLSAVHIVHTNDFIVEVDAQLRRKYKLKLPDAIIAATCFFLDIPLVTCDNDFDKIDDLQILKLSYTK